MAAMKTLYSKCTLSVYYSLRTRRVNVRFFRVLGRGKRVFKADLSTISNLNAKLIITTLSTDQRAFRDPQFAYISVTFLFTSNTHFQDFHTHFYGTERCLSRRISDRPSAKTVTNYAFLLILRYLRGFCTFGRYGTQPVATFKALTTWSLLSLWSSCRHLLVRSG